MMPFKRLFARKRLYADVCEEIRAHLEEKIEELVADGMPREEAETTARREFGNVSLTEEDSRAVWRWAAIEDYWMDVRFGARVLRKNAGFTAVAVVTLALGIAANSTIFSAVNGWMLRPPRIEEPGRVVAILMTDPVRRRYGWDQNAVSAADFVAWREHSQSFTGVVASELNDFAVTGEGEPERVPGMRVSAEYFRLLGVNAALGRTFVRGEDQAGRAQGVVISHGLWQRRFAGDPKAIGKSLRLDGESHTVIGIMPNGFRVGYYGPQLWAPLVFAPERLVPSARSERSLTVLARLKPGVSVETANAEVATLAQRAEQTYPGTTQGWGARAVVLQKWLADEFKVGMRIQMSAVVLLLLIACANIASLQLTRGTGRQTEIAVRTALGASRVRLVRQLLVESLLIGLSGGAGGLLLTIGGVRWLRGSLTWSSYVSEMAPAVTIDPTVVAYTVALSLLTAAAFGLVPALRQTAVNLQSTLKEGSRTSSAGRSRLRAQSALVTAQVAMALALLTGAGLMTRGYLHTSYSGFGIDPKKVLIADVGLTSARYKEPARQAAFFHEAIERVESMPGVVSAGGATTLVLDRPAPQITFLVQGQAGLSRKDRPKAGYVAVTPRYLETLRVPLLRGRNFDARDNADSAPVALVNAALVRRYFPNQEAVGKHIRLDTGDSERADWSEIVGVVGNIRELSDDWEETPQVYEPYFQKPSSALTLALRSNSDSAEFAPVLRRAIWDIDSEQPVASIRTIDEVIASNFAGMMTVLTMMGSFASLALAMSIVGVFGVMAYTVARRTHEIGIRIALGAKTSDVLRMIARKGIVLGGIGIAIGFGVAIPLALLPTGMAPGMPFAQGASVIAAAGVLLWLVTLAASYIPARRATRVDPTTALRCE